MENNMMHGNRYDPKLTGFMEKAMKDHGFNLLHTQKDVEKFFGENSEFLFVVNSVCGCAASSARPGVFRALEKSEKLRKMKRATVFAGVDIEATQKARDYFNEYEKSSPNIIIFRNKKPVIFMERKDIVHKEANEIAKEIIEKLI